MNLEIEHESAKIELMMKNDLILRRAEINQKNYGQTVRNNSMKSRKILRSEIRKQRERNNSPEMGLISQSKGPIPLTKQNKHDKSPDLTTTKQYATTRDVQEEERSESSLSSK